MIAFAAGARYVVGGDSRPFGWDISRQAYSLEMPSRLDIEGSAVEHSLAPLVAVGITTSDHTTVVVPAAVERARAGSLIAELELNEGFWVLHPGAGKLQNLWPAERFAEIAELASAAGHDVLVLHGPADGAALASLTAAIKAPTTGRVRVAPQLSVGIAAALLERAGRLLCNDTGIMHIAGALRLPTVALFGPTDPTVWKPPAEEVVALRAASRRADARGKEFGWMETISVAEVWRTLSSLPSRGEGANRS
jgi:ADP-heptose:LPS heptosyltransferase